MSIAPTPSIPRGAEPSLQGFYYTSSPFVTALREDIEALLSAYAHAYAREPFEPENPFELFKSTWKSLGWNYAHLTCVDTKRPIFLSTVGRCFIERVADTSEHPLRRAAALFGLYIWYMTQPHHSEINIPFAEYIAIPIDTYEVILQLHTLYAPPLRSYITFIVSQFLSQSLFHIIPSTKYHAYNPRDLPHTMPLLTRGIEGGHGNVSVGKKKRGRPSQMDQAQRAEKVLLDLEVLLERGVDGGMDGNGSATTSAIALNPPDSASLKEYLALKEQLKEAIPPDRLKNAEEITLQRVEAAEEHIKRKNLDKQLQHEGLERLREQVQQEGGLLSLFGSDTRKGKGKA